MKPRSMRLAMMVRPSVFGLRHTPAPLLMPAIALLLLWEVVSKLIPRRVALPLFSIERTVQALEALLKAPHFPATLQVMIATKEMAVNTPLVIPAPPPLSLLDHSLHKINKIRLRIIVTKTIEEGDKTSLVGFMDDR